MKKISTTYVDYQQRAKGFQVGQRVFPFTEGKPTKAGVVVRVHPSIGMVDVQFPHGSVRLPVEDLVIDTSKETSGSPSGESSLPEPPEARVVDEFLNKKALYWAARDRQYKVCKNENPLKPMCPKCKDQMGKTVYKRRDGISDTLFVCHQCLFVIKPTDMIGG
jgi:hypothetical protein